MSDPADLRCLAWKWGDGCASAHVDDKGRIVIRQWNADRASRATQPSRAEIMAAQAAFAAHLAAEDPKRLARQARAAAYPPIADQLDAIWKHLAWRRLEGDALAQQADDMLGRVLAVKRDIPVPGED